MRELSFTLLEVHEAAKHLEVGDEAHLRLALVLLDNAVERIMARRIRADVEHDEMFKRLQEVVRATPGAEASGQFDDLLAQSVLSPEKLEELDRDFARKLGYLTSTAKAIRPQIQRSLRRLHAYRNDAYHREFYRQEVLEPAAHLLLRVTCELLRTVGPGAIVYRDGEESAWIKKEYGTLAESSDAKSVVATVVDAVESRLHLKDLGIGDELAGHLERRLAALDRQLAEFKFFRFITDAPTALAAAQHYRATKNGDIKDLPLKDYVPEYKMRDVDLLRSKPTRIREAADPTIAFDRFAEAEESLEKIEAAIEDLAMDLDYEIERQRDLEGGK